MKKRLLFQFMAFSICLAGFAQQPAPMVRLESPLHAAVWQWSVSTTAPVSGETGESPQAFLWIPEDCDTVRAVVFGQHNMCEETIFTHPAFRITLSELGFAIVWVTPVFEQQWKVENSCQQVFETMMNGLAETSGYSELKTAPVVPLGHSAMATFPWNFAAWNKERTLAVISYKGDAPRTNLCGYGRENLEWGRTRNIDGIPGLMIEGEYEWWEARVNPALAFRMMYPESCISFLADVGQGHFDVSDKTVDYICLFLRKTAEYRLSPKSLNILNPHNGWLAERWHPVQPQRPQTAPFAEYKGNPHDAFWYFDREIAEATENYYIQKPNRKMQFIGFEQNGRWLNYVEESHEDYKTVITPEADGLTFHLKALFTDTMHTVISPEQMHEKIKIDRICGPVAKVNDSAFAVRFYCMGMNNRNRTGDIWLFAHADGDDEYKSAVQQINIRVPYPLKESKSQKITFPEIVAGANLRVCPNKNVLSPNATSDSGLPVYYYVKEGAAQIVDNEIVLTKIPPRAKFPHKITVVAWQYGVERKWNTAEPVEQSFYVVNNKIIHKQ
jgi:hypothetical protein